MGMNTDRRRRASQASPAAIRLAPDHLWSSKGPPGVLSLPYWASLLEEVGGWRPGYGAEEDHDLHLRATEHARAVGHVAAGGSSRRIRPPSQVLCRPDPKTR